MVEVRGRARRGPAVAGAHRRRCSTRASPAVEIAVFYRTNAQSRVLEDLLVRHGVPYQVIGGPRFYERAEIKDAMAYLQVLDNPADDVALRADHQHAARAASARRPSSVWPRWPRRTGRTLLGGARRCSSAACCRPAAERAVRGVPRR